AVARPGEALVHRARRAAPGERHPEAPAGFDGARGGGGEAAGPLLGDRVRIGTHPHLPGEHQPAPLTAGPATGAATAAWTRSGSARSYVGSLRWSGWWQVGQSSTHSR